MGLLRLLLDLAGVRAAAAPSAGSRRAAADLQERLSTLTAKASLDREAFLTAVLACAAPIAAHWLYALRRLEDLSTNSARFYR